MSSSVANAGVEHTTADDIAIDSATKSIVQGIPLCSVSAGPGDDRHEWGARLRQELKSLIAYVQANKARDHDWFFIEPSEDGVTWTGRCWFVHNLAKYEFKLLFTIPVSYPAAPFEIILPELDGLTPKMYRGGKICLSVHFAPLWNRNSPRFGIAHALAMGLAPWLATEVPSLADKGLIVEAGAGTEVGKRDEK